MKIDLTEVEGLWVLTKRWSLSYWPPKAWKPLSVRSGQRGLCGRLGAVSIERRRDSRRHEPPPFEVDKGKLYGTLWASDHPLLEQR